MTPSQRRLAAIAVALKRGLLTVSRANELMGTLWGEPDGAPGMYRGASATTVGLEGRPPGGLQPGTHSGRIPVTLRSALSPTDAELVDREVAALEADELDFGTGGPKVPEMLYTLDVQDGETMVIGGVFVDTQGNNVQGVPYLSRIPVLGWLFKNKSETVSKQELLIFITPTIVDDGGTPWCVGAESGAQVDDPLVDAARLVEVAAAGVGAADALALGAPLPAAGARVVHPEVLLDAQVALPRLRLRLQEGCAPGGQVPLPPI